MAAYAYRNVLTGSLVSSLQLDENAIYDDFLSNYVYDDYAGSALVVDDYAINPLDELLKTAIQLNSETLTVNGQILLIKNTSSPIFVGPLLGDLSLKVVIQIPIEVPPPDPDPQPGPTLQALSFKIVSTSPVDNSTPPPPVGPTLNTLSLTVSNTSPVSNSMPGANTGSSAPVSPTLRDLSLTISS